MKIKINVVLPYSVLKPETNSLSPSAKSKGDRFVSAKIEVIHIKIMGPNIKDVEWPSSRIFLSLQDIDRKIIDRIIITILISYEIVWATLRIVPRRAYFEFDPHPIIIVGYTLHLEIIINSSKEKLNHSVCGFVGIRVQRVRAIINVKIGPLT